MGGGLDSQVENRCSRVLGSSGPSSLPYTQSSDQQHFITSNCDEFDRLPDELQLALRADPRLLLSMVSIWSKYNLLGLSNESHNVMI